MTTERQGAHVVVTGGGRGLGEAIVRRFQADGARVTVMVRAASEGAVTCDVTDPDSVANAFAFAVTSHGPVHTLINNAGVAVASVFSEITLATWQHVMAVNLTGPFLCAQQVLPRMLANGSGRIINVASTAGLRGGSRITAYCASKHGVVGLTRALAAETARTGITVNAVCPGYIEGSKMLEGAIANVARVTGASLDQARAILLKQTPNGRFATEAEVVDQIVRLCSDSAATTTGQAIVVEGGNDQP